ncbi:MAG: hypothetical protein K2I07_03090 [Lachnospiraceae bacterium]|nr:hypothetical protein [Lachnospiraceae bacterium]
MKKVGKKLAGAVLILSLAVGYTGIPASAKDMLNGYEVSGGVTTNSNSATATTSYSRPATIKAKAWVSYTYGDLFLENDSPVAEVNIGGVSATAVVPVSGGTVTGGKGEHWVKASGDWHKITRVGNSKS